jgi:hypothetical protein
MGLPFVDTQSIAQLKSNGCRRVSNTAVSKSENSQCTKNALSTKNIPFHLIFA